MRFSVLSFFVYCERRNNRRKHDRKENYEYTQ
nr:MAG TPA: hypothetical protein [Herelleviridae sp.]